MGNGREGQIFIFAVPWHVGEIGQLDRRSSSKSGVKAFSITFRFATNKIIPDDSLEEGTIYILNSLLKTTSSLPKAPMLSAD